jgi:citrate lyase subunit beta/citryl-CoA lyase
MRLRSLLFAPGDRPDLIAKLGRSCPDIAVIDLEDGIRSTETLDLDRTAAAVRELQTVSRDQRIMIRVRSANSPAFTEHIEWVLSLSVRGVVIPKVEGKKHLDVIRSAAGTLPVVAGIETAAGVADVEVIESPPVLGARAAMASVPAYVAFFTRRKGGY